MRHGRASARSLVLLGTLAACLAAYGSVNSISQSAFEPSAEPSSPSPAPPTTARADPEEVASAAAAIAAADMAKPESIDAVDAVRLTDAGFEAAAAALSQGATGDALWAATWVYASGGMDPAPLRPLLTAEDPSVRAMAAAALLALGEKDAFAPLIALLGSDDHLRGSLPPLVVGDYAAGTLARFVAGPSLQPDAARSDVATAWSAWLTEHGSTLTYDAQTGQWSAP